MIYLVTQFKYCCYVIHYTYVTLYKFKFHVFDFVLANPILEPSSDK